MNRRPRPLLALLVLPLAAVALAGTMDTFGSSPIAVIPREDATSSPPPPDPDTKPIPIPAPPPPPPPAPPPAPPPTDQAPQPPAEPDTKPIPPPTTPPAPDCSLGICPGPAPTTPPMTDQVPKPPGDPDPDTKPVGPRPPECQDPICPSPPDPCVDPVPPPSPPPAADDPVADDGAVVTPIGGNIPDPCPPPRPPSHCPPWGEVPKPPEEPPPYVVEPMSVAIPDPEGCLPPPEPDDRPQPAPCPPPDESGDFFDDILERARYRRCRGLYRHDPILFLHGINSDKGTWDKMVERFRDKGYPEDYLYAVSYDWKLRNAVTAGFVEEKVQELLDRTGASKVDIITHSMGGFGSRWYLKFMGGTQYVDDWVSLGGPNHGTIWPNTPNPIAGACRVGPIPSCEELRIGSAFLLTLNAGDETPGEVHYGTWWSPCDGAVMPGWSTILIGAENTRTRCILHGEYQGNKRIFRQVFAFVTEGDVL